MTDKSTQTKWSKKKKSDEDVVLNINKSTPDGTIFCNDYEMLLRLNHRGKGCCK